MKSITVLTPFINNNAGTEYEAAALSNELNNAGYTVTLIAKENIAKPYCKAMLNKGIQLLSWQSILQKNIFFKWLIYSCNTLRPGKVQTFNVVPFDAIDRWLKNKVWTSKEGKKRISQTDALIIVTTSYFNYYVQPALLAYAYKKMVVFNMTTCVFRANILPNQNLCLQQANKIFVKSLNAKQTLSLQAGPNLNMELQGVFLLDEEKLLQIEHPHKPGHCRLGMLAMYRREKNFEDILHALYLLQQKKLPHVFSLTIGGHGNQLYYQQLQAYIQKYQIKNVVFAGNLTGEARWDFFRTTDVYIVTSLEEGGPNAALEAMAAGIPSVASKVGAMQDWMQWDERLTYNVYDAQELASKLEVVASTLQANPNSFDYMRQLYKDLYSNQTITNQYQQLLKQWQDA